MPVHLQVTVQGLLLTIHSQFLISSPPAILTTEHIPNWTTYLLHAGLSLHDGISSLRPLQTNPKQAEIIIPIKCIAHPLTSLELPRCSRSFRPHCSLRALPLPLVLPGRSSRPSPQLHGFFQLQAPQWRVARNCFRFRIKRNKGA